MVRNDVLQFHLCVTVKLNFRPYIFGLLELKLFILVNSFSVMSEHSPGLNQLS